MLKMGKSYINIKDGVLEIKHKGSFIMNGVLGGASSGEIIADKIENFSLLYFQIMMKYNISFILLHKETGIKYRVEIMVSKDKLNDYLTFRDITEGYGVFENKKRMDVFYGKDSNIQKEIEESKRKKKEQKNFYDDLKQLPGFDSWGTKKEIRYLKNIINNEEEIFAIASGIMENNTWLLSCTNKRILFIDCGMIYGVKHSEIMIDKVNAVSFKNGLMLGEIHIEDGASARIVKNVQKYSTQQFVDAVHKAMDLSKKENSVVIQNASSNEDELLKFKKLLDIGAITKEEFEEQKRKLLEI